MLLRHLVVAVGFLALALPIASAQLGSSFVPASRSPPAEANTVTGYLVWNGGKGGISWDAGAVTEDPGGPADAALGVVGKAYGYAGWVAYSNTGQSSLIPTFTFTSQAVPTPIVLNASLPIRVELQRQKCVALSVELWMDAVFIGGQMFGIPSSRPLKAGTGYCAGVYGTFHLHPEVLVIPAGAILTLKVLVHDQNDPIQLGFKDDHRSLILFPVHTPEELVFRGLTPEGKAGGGEPSGPGAGLALLAPAALLARSSRRGALGLALLVILAGCAGPATEAGRPGTTPTEPTGGKLNSTVIKGSEVPPGLASNRTGSILGKVHDDLGFPVPKAHVFLGGSAHFNDTDAHGQFVLRSVEPGTYELFVQHSGFRPFQAKVQVAAEEILRVDIEMELPQPREFNDRPHRHDYWPESGIVERFNGDVSTGSPDTCTSSATELLPLFFPPGFLTMPSYCAYSFHLSPDAGGRSTILPGTREIEVKVSWPPGQNVLNRVGVLWYSNLDSFATFMYPRGNGATTRIVVGPEHADFGHQALTSWRFQLYVWSNGGGQSLGGDTNSGFIIRPGASLLMTPLHAEVRLHKGFVPLEPAHPDFWGPNVTVPVWSGKLQGSCFATCNYPNGWHPNGFNDGWGPGQLVPPDTQWLEVVLSRVGAPGTIPNSKWGFLYKPGDVPFPSGDFAGFREPNPPTTEGAAKRYVIPVKPEQQDGFYARRTNWAIALDDGLPPDSYPYYDSVELKIDVTAHRDAPPTK